MGWRPWLPVLAYHRVVERMPAVDPAGNCITARRFQEQMAWLRRAGFHTVDLVRVEAAIAEGRTLPRRSVVITFDDGYEDTYRIAWPIMRRYGLKGAVFVVAGAVGGDNDFDREVSAPAAMMSQAQLRGLLREGFDIGAHSLTHPPDLRSLDSARLDHELAAGRGRLEEILQTPVPYFAYPRSRHDERVRRAVQARYRMAFGGEGREFSRACVSRIIAPQQGAAGLAAHWLRRRVATALPVSTARAFGRHLPLPAGRR